MNYANLGGDPTKYVDIIISDIEMPQMDGHHLIKKIKSNQVLQNIPVVIFSSISNEQIKDRGKELGAVSQISKPEMNKLVNLIDKILEI